MAYGVRCSKLQWKEHVDIFGIMILKSELANMIAFVYEASLVLLNMETSESHKSRQCYEWLL